MARDVHFVDAPRIQVVLVPDEAGAINSKSALFDLWFVLHVPDGQAPTTVRIDGGPFDRGAAVEKLSEIWVDVGKRYAENLR